MTAEIEYVDITPAWTGLIRSFSRIIQGEFPVIADWMIRELSPLVDGLLEETGRDPQGRPVRGEVSA